MKTTCTYPIYCADSSDCSQCTELKDIAQKLDILHSRQAEICETLNAQRDATSKLPVEVICHIFEAYVRLHKVNPPPQLLPLSEDIHVGFPQYFDTFHRSAPLLLGSICRRWRQIAWSYPNLWNTLLVPFKIEAHIHGAALVAEWLERSKSLPLDIKALGRGVDDFMFWFPEEHGLSSGDKPPSQGPFYSAVNVIEVIDRFAPRWRSVDFIDVAPELTQFLGESRPTAKSILQHFSASRDPDDYEFESTVPFLDTWGKDYYAPTHISINLCDMNPPVDVDFSRLTHVNLNDVRKDVLSSLIKLASEARAPLMALSARSIWLESRFEDLDDEDLDEKPPVVSLPLLETLSLTSSEQDSMVDIVDHLMVPGLRSLHYTAREAIFPQSSICSLIRRSGCTLEHLILHDATDSLRTLNDVLHAVPNLHKLTATFLNAESWLCFQLGTRTADFTDAARSWTLLPSLKKIHITAPPLSIWKLVCQSERAQLPLGIQEVHNRLQELDTFQYEPLL